MTNNTIVAGQGVGADGIHAVEKHGVTTLTLRSNIITGQAYGVRFDRALSGAVTISHNDVWGNTIANYQGLADPTGTNGNISADPLFVRGPPSRVGGWAYPGHYLSQTAAGEPADSPALDAGSGLAPTRNLAARTTRSDSEPDGGVDDMGFHYPLYYRHSRAFLPLCIR